MIQPPEYTDGFFRLYRIKNDTSTDYPEKYLEPQNLEIWYREISVFDRIRYEFDQAGKEITLKIRIPLFKEINSKCMCVIGDIQHQVYNVAHIKDKNGFPETELTLIRPESELRTT